jgi:hypothetical protein
MNNTTHTALLKSHTLHELKRELSRCSHVVRTAVYVEPTVLDEPKENTWKTFCVFGAVLIALIAVTGMAFFLMVRRNGNSDSLNTFRKSNATGWQSDSHAE